MAPVLEKLALRYSKHLKIGKLDVDRNEKVPALTYTYRVAPDWSALISVGVLDAEASTSASGAGVETETAAVMPILFGAKYSPALSSRRSSVRPYLSGAAGPYLGFATNSRAGVGVSNETISEVAFGFRAMGGADWFLSAHVVLGVGVGYHFVTNFDESIGTEDNYSGPEFSVGIGFVIHLVQVLRGSKPRETLVDAVLNLAGFCLGLSFFLEDGTLGSYVVGGVSVLALGAYFTRQRWRRGRSAGSPKRTRLHDRPGPA